MEQQLLVVVDGLSEAPVPLESLETAYGLDRGDVPALLDVGKRAGLVQVLRTIDGDLAYSPFFGFENPELFAGLVERHGTDRLAEEFHSLRAKQGMPVDASTHPLLADAVARGLVMAPSVDLPDGTRQAFAALPYVPDKSLLTARKPVLDKALAVLACLRCAEYRGGYSSLSPAGLVAVIDKLLDPNRGFLNGTAPTNGSTSSCTGQASSPSAQTRSPAGPGRYRSSWIRRTTVRHCAWPET